MDRFRKSLSESLLTRLVSYLLVIQLIFPPLWINNVYAALITDPHASVEFQPQIDNSSGIPVINIVAPNTIGLSHNKYQDFDVEQDGLIFNNSLVTGNSRLAGQIVANPLFGGRTASIILNEVTGASDSSLKGLMEVFGDKANVIIANPNGITCNGCGFINTQRATLTTGIPELSTGRLRLDVDGGLIRFEDEGYSYRSFVDEVDVLSRYIEINGDISTKNRLSLVAGRYIFDYSKSIAGSQLPDWIEKKTDSKPQDASRTLAIDGSIFGAMQSGQIDIMGTEEGLGVKADGYLFAQADDLFIQSAGGLALNNADAVREINLIAQDDIVIGADLIANLAVTAHSNSLGMADEANLIASEVILQAEDELNLKGDIKAFDIALESQSLISDADLLAINTLNLNTTDRAQVHDSVIASEEIFMSSDEAEFTNVELKATNLTLTANKTSALQTNLESTDLVANLGESDSTGLEIVAATADIKFTNWQDKNSNWHIGSLVLTGNQLDSEEGQWLFNEGELKASELGLDNNQIFTYQGDIEANNLQSANSQIYAEKLALTINEALTSTGDVWRVLPFSEDSEIEDSGQFNLVSDQANFTNSIIQANEYNLNSEYVQFANTGVAASTIAIDTSELNTDKETLWLANDQINIRADSTANIDHTIKTTDLDLNAGKTDISGHWLITNTADITAATSLDIDDFSLTAQSVTVNSDNGRWDNLSIKTNSSDITVNDALAINSGTIESTQLTLAANQLSLDSNTWLGANETSINSDQLNNEGTLLAADLLEIESREIDNLGEIASFDKLNITQGELLNNQGAIIADKLVIDSASTINDNSISSKTLLLEYQNFENTENANLLTNEASYTAKSNTADFSNYGMQVASDSMQWLTNQTSSGYYTNAGLLTGSNLHFSGLNQVTNGVLVDGNIQGSIQAVNNPGAESAEGLLTIGAEEFSQLGSIEADKLTINREEFHNEGSIYSGELNANINNEFNNSGILASDAMKLNAGVLNNAEGSTISTDELSFENTNVNNAGNLIATAIEVSGNDIPSSYFMNSESGKLIQNAIEGRASISGFDTFTNKGLIETDALLTIDNIGSFNNLTDNLSDLDNATRIVSESGVKISNTDSFNNSAILVADALSITSNTFNNSGILGAGEAVIDIKQDQLINSGRIYQSDLVANEQSRDQVNTLNNEFIIQANGLTNSESASIELALGRIDLQGGDLVNKGLIRELDKENVTSQLSIENVKHLENYNDLSVSTDLLIAESGSISNIGENSYIKANTIAGTGLSHVNNEGALLANETIELNSQSINNSENADIFAKTISFNASSFTNNSRIGSEQAIEIYSTSLINNALAEIYSNDGSIRLSGNERLANNGNVIANTDLFIESDLLSNKGILNAQNEVAVNQQSVGVIDNDGYIFADSVKIGNDNFRQLKVSNNAANSENLAGEVILGGIQAGEAGLKVITNTLANNGLMSSDYELSIDADESMAGSNALSGTLEAKGRLTLNTLDLEMTSSAKIIALGGDNAITVSKTINNAGLISVENSSTISSSDLLNSGVVAGTSLDIHVTDDFLNSANTSQIYADDLNLVSDTLTNHGVIQANKTLDLGIATEAVNTHQIIALDRLAIHGDGDAADRFNNSGTLSSKELDLAVTSLVNNTEGVISAESANLVTNSLNNSGTLHQLESDSENAAFNIQAQALSNTGASATIDVKNGLFNLNTLINQGLIREREEAASVSDQLLITQLKTLDNSGELVLYSDLDLTAASLKNTGNEAYIRTESLTASDLNSFSNEGKIAAQDALILSSQQSLLNQGELVANQLTVASQQDFINSGLVQAEAKLEIDAKNITNDTSAEISKIGATNNLALTATGIINNAGNIASKTGLDIAANEVINSQDISASLTTTLLANSLNNTGLIYGKNLNVGSSSQYVRQTREGLRVDSEPNQGGLIAAETLSLYTQGIMNDVYRAQAIHLESNTDLTLAGKIEAEKQIDVITENLTVNNSGSLYIADSTEASTLSITHKLHNAGDISSQSSLMLNTGEIQNEGEIKTAKQLTINANRINTAVDSLISSADSLKLSGAGSSDSDIIESFINSGNIVTDKSLTISTEVLTNEGNIQATGNLELTAKDLTNNQSIQSNQQLNIIANKVLNGEGAQLSSLESLTIKNSDNNKVDSLNNSGTISSKDLNLSATIVTNNSNAVITAETANLSADTLTNSGTLYQLESEIENAAFDVQANTLSNDGKNSIIDVKNGLFNLNTLINQGLIREREESASVADKLLLSNVTMLDNSGELILYSDLSLTGASLKNTGSEAYIRAKSLTANNLSEFSNEGKIAAEDALTLSSEITLLNQGKLIANQFTATSQQDFINSDLVQASEKLEINAQNITNELSAEISTIGVDSDLKLTATNNLANDGNIASRAGLRINANDLSNNQNISASNTSSLLVNSLNNTGLIYGNNLTVGSSSQYVNQARSGLRTEAQVNLGGLVAANTLTLYTQGLMKDAYKANRINIVSNDKLDIYGQIKANQELDISAAGLAVKNSGDINVNTSYGKSDWNITGDVTNNGDLSIGSNLDIISTSVTNHKNLNVHKNLTITTNSINNTAGANISANTLVSIKAVGDGFLESATNSGTISSNNILIKTNKLDNNNDAVLVAKQADINIAETLNNAGGIYQITHSLTSTNNDFNLTAKELNNLSSNNSKAANIQIAKGYIDSETINNNGLIVETQNLRLASDKLSFSNVKELNNSGTIIVDSGLDISGGTFINRANEVGRQAYFQASSLTAAELKGFDNTGLIILDGSLDIASQDSLKNEGEIVANTVTIETAKTFTNLNTIISQGLLTIEAESIHNDVDSSIVSKGTQLFLSTANYKADTNEIKNLGNIASAGSLDINTTRLDNQNVISASGDATLDIEVLNNQKLIFANNLTVGSAEKKFIDDRSGIQVLDPEQQVGLVANNSLTLYTSGLMKDVYQANIVDLYSADDIQLSGTINAANKANITAKDLTINQASLIKISGNSGADSSMWNLSGSIENSGNINSTSSLSIKSQGFINNNDIRVGGNLYVDSDYVKNSSQKIEGSVAKISSKGLLNISGSGVATNDRATSLVNEGEIVADSGFNLYADSIVNKNNIKATGNSDWGFASLENTPLDIDTPSRISVDGLWTLGTETDRVGIIDNDGKLYGESISLFSNGNVNNNEGAQIVAYGDSLSIDAQGDITNNGAIYSNSDFSLNTTKDINNNGTLESFTNSDKSSSISAKVVNNGNGTNTSGKIVVAGDLIITSDSFNNNSYEGDDTGKSMNVEKILSYRYDSSTGGNKYYWRHYVGYGDAEVKDNIYGSLLQVGGDLAVNNTNFLNRGSTVSVNGNMTLDNSEFNNESNKLIELDTKTLSWYRRTYNNKEATNKYAKSFNTRIAAGDAAEIEAKNELKAAINKIDGTYYWAGPWHVNETNNVATQAARPGDSPDGVSPLVVEGERATVSNPYDLGTLVVGGNITGTNSSIKNLGYIKAASIKLKDEVIQTVDLKTTDDEVLEKNEDDLSRANTVSQTSVNNTDSNLAGSTSASDNQAVAEHNENTNTVTSESNQAITDSTTTETNTGATSGSGTSVSVNQPIGAELNSESIASYESTVQDLTSARDNTGANQGNNTVVNADHDAEQKELLNDQITSGNAASTEGLDTTDDHVKGSFINGADGLVIQVANRKPTASISLLSFIIPGLSFDALSAASVAGDKSAEELAAQSALQAQLDLLESDKDKNSDTIKGQSNSYDAQAPSLFDLDEDILQRIIADTEYELSPEYIFDKVDPDRILDTEPKFFLDPYQEAQAVTKAALQQTGSAFFSPDWSSSSEQRQGLYDNTLLYLEAQQEATLGKALTPMQVKQLEKPMIWYVSMNIGGQSQLVPTVYLPEATLEQITTPSAGTIIADSMDIDVGDFKNTGDIQVANSARIQADVITNQRNVMTFGDATNYGAIAGTGGNISAGNLELISATDINNNGGSLTATHDLLLDAGNDINLNALELSSRTQNGSSINESTEFVLSQINVGGNATFNSGGDFYSEAAQAKIEGSATFNAENINMLGVEERTYSQTTKKKKDIFSSSKTTIEQEQITFVGSTFNVGEDLTMNAENDIIMEGAYLDVGQTAELNAGNDITLTAGISTDTYSKNKSGSGIATTSSQQKGHVQQEATGTVIKTGGSIKIDSDGGDVAILASELNAEENIILGDTKIKRDENDAAILDENGQYISEDGSSIANLTIGTVELKDESWNEKSSGLKGPLKDLAAVAAFTLSASGMGQLAMAAGVDTEIEVGKTEETRIESTTHVTSTIDAGNNLVVLTDENVLIEGAKVDATNAVIQSQSTTITAVENTTITTESESTHTVEATQTTLKEDEVTVAGATETKHTETTTTTETELVKADINISGSLNMNSVENIDVLASDVDVDGNSTVTAESITVAGLTETTTIEHQEKTETTTTSIGVKNAYVDAALALKAVSDAGAALEDAQVALDEAKRQVRDGTLQANAIEDYEANLAAATAQLAQATLSVAAAGATAAGSTGTGGFYASGSAETSITEKTSTSTESEYVGSTFNVGGDASFNAADSIDIIGSAVGVAGGLELNASDVTIKAGVEETSSTSSETTRTAGVTASYGSGGSDAFSGGVNASGSNTDSDSYSKTHINSTITAGSLTSTSDNLTLSGANVEVAGNIDIDTGNLVIESLQDESSSSSKTEGYNASGSIGGNGDVSPGSVGANQNNSNSDSQWVNNQTTLMGGMSGEGEVNITADSTTITGAAVASATRDENGVLTDNGNLNLATDELVINNLEDKNHSESEGFNVSASSGSTTVGLTSNGHKTEQDTLATLGGGNITKKDGSEHEEGVAESANSDLNNSQVITKNQDIGGLDATVTVDHRVLTEEGRQDIAENFQDSYEHGEDIARAVDTIIESDELGILNTGESIHNNAMATQLKNDLVRNPDNAHILAGLQSENPEEYAAATQALGKLAQEKFGLEASEINLYDGDETTSGTLANNALGDVAGGVVIDESNSEYGNIFIDAGDDATKTDMANTLGHEVLETQALQGQDGGVFGANSEQTQEALGNAFGEQFADRIDQAAGGNLDSTGGSNFNTALKNSDAVAAGTQSANNVGNATVDHRQLYVAEAKAIIEAAPAYAEKHDISEAEAKKELTQQALLQVDKEWSEQKHIEENPEAREALAEISASNSPAKDGYVEGGEVGLFIATPDDYENTYINANQARMIEEGMAGEEGFLSTNATANGEMPVGLTPGEVVTGTIGGALNSLQDAGEALIDDFPSAMQSAASAIGESVSGCIDQGIGCVASDPREGYSGDRAFVDLLQGDKESAIGNNATAMAGEVLPAATVVNQTGRVVGEVAESIKESVSHKSDSAGGKNGSSLGEGDDFYQQDPNSGEYYWPDDSGFDGARTEQVIPVGAIVDRFGPEKGSFMSDPGSTFSERALGPGDGIREYHKYKVLKPLPVIEGKIAPAFGKEGGGTQMLPNFDERVNVKWLIENNYLEEVQ